MRSLAITDLSRTSRQYRRAPRAGHPPTIPSRAATRDRRRPDPTYVARRLARNRAWFERASELGATKYPIGALEFTAEDWARHYGALWDEFRKRTQRYDPDNVLSPGSGVFR